MASNNTPNTTSRLVQIAAAFVVVFALRYTKEVMVPIALAMLFSFLLAPLVHRLERMRIPRVPAVLLVATLAFSLIGLLGYTIIGQARDLTENLPHYAATIEQRISWVKHMTNGSLSKLRTEAARLAHDATTSQPTTSPAGSLGNLFSHSDEIQKVEIVSSSPSLVTTVLEALGPVLDMAASAFIITVLCIFMLLQREDLRDRLLRLVSNGHLLVTTQAMDEAATRVSRYLLMQSIINSMYAICVTTGLLILHIPNALLWGLLAGILRFIPYVGPWIGAAGPLILSLAMAGSTRPIYTIGLFMGLEVVAGSVVEPWLYGSNTGVSAIAILAAAIFWAWLWGIVGLLLATPLTVVLVVLGKYVPQLEFLNVLLGDEPAFDPPTRYYQRLLASDSEEANELVDQYLQTQTLGEVYESVLMRALGLIQNDRFSGLLDDDRQAYVLRAMQEQVEELGERRVVDPVEKKVDTSILGRVKAEKTARDIAQARGAAPPPEDKVVKPSRVQPNTREIQILCLPARDKADEIAGIMFAQILERSGYKAEAVSVNALASEMVELVERKKADIVVISALPPSAVQHARYIYKRLNQRFPDLRIMVGLWTAQGDLSRQKERICTSARDALAADFTGAMAIVHELQQPLLLDRAARPELSAGAATETVEV